MTSNIDNTLEPHFGETVGSVGYTGRQSTHNVNNQGTKFEIDLALGLYETVTNNNQPTNEYYLLTKQLIDVVRERNPSPIIRIEETDNKNEKRPFIMKNGKLVIFPGNPVEVGKIISDTTIYHEDGTETYISAKSGSTVTFVNTGVKGPGKPFPENEVKSGKIKNEMGENLLSVLGIDGEIFCNVFNLYGTGKKATGRSSHIVDVTDKVNISSLTSLLRSAIGANYWMVHNQGDGKAYCWWIGEEENEKYANIQDSKFELYYGGSSGTAKRIDMKFSNPYFDFKINIRNKQRGVSPTHIMLDYVSKPATGKKMFGGIGDDEN